MAILNSQATGLPPGIAECSFDEWKKVRQITLPAFTNAKLRMVIGPISLSLPSSSPSCSLSPPSL